MNGHVRRPLPGADLPRAATWIDNLVVDSAYDYDPLWARCEALGVAPVFHSSGMGWGSRVSPTNYVFNHLGSFAAGAETMCRALFLGGVLRRFPKLRFAFLEGGAGWACSLYADLVGHFEKRGSDGVRCYDPAALDHTLLADLFRRYGSERFASHLDALPESLRVLADP